VSALVPQGWETRADLVCGFGSRHAAPPVGVPVASARQVHGAAVVAAADALVMDLEGDAVTVAEEGSLAAVRTADCVPILLLASHGRWGASVHAGWRGTFAGVAAAAVAAAERAGIAPSELQAAIGPAIGPCCYEVGEDLAARFEAAGMPAVRDGRSARLDLRAINRTALLTCGLPPARIQVCGPCTRCRSDLYWSHRADPTGAGRQLSWIGWARRTPDMDRGARP